MRQNRRKLPIKPFATRWRTLASVEQAPPAPVTDVEKLHLYDVIDKLHEGDTFVKAWGSFHALKSGDLIGTRHDGTPVLAPEDGCILSRTSRHSRATRFYLTRKVD